MKLINSKIPLLIRTEFTNESCWNKIIEIIKTPENTYGFVADVEILNDKKFENLNDYSKLDTKIYFYSFLFIIDTFCMENPEHPVLCIGLQENKGKSFRVIPSELWSPVSNLSISNMDFDEFVHASNKDGIFRGF